MGGILQCLMNVAFVSIAGEVQCHANAACARGVADAYAEITSIFLPNANEEQVAKARGRQDPFGGAFASQPFEDSVSSRRRLTSIKSRTLA